MPLRGGGETSSRVPVLLLRVRCGCDAGVLEGPPRVRGMPSQDSAGTSLLLVLHATSNRGTRETTVSPRPRRKGGLALGLEGEMWALRRGGRGVPVACGELLLHLGICGKDFRLVIHRHSGPRGGVAFVGQFLARPSRDPDRFFWADDARGVLRQE